MHPGDVGPDRPGSARVVADQRGAPDQSPRKAQYSSALTVSLPAKLTTTGSGEPPRGPDGQAHVVVLVDRVVVVRGVGVQITSSPRRIRRNRLTGVPPSGPYVEKMRMMVSGLPASLCGEAHDGLPRDLRQAVGPEVDPRRIVLAQRSLALVRVGRSRRAVHEGGARRRPPRAARRLGVRREDGLPVLVLRLAAEARRRVEDMRDPRGAGAGPSPPCRPRRASPRPPPDASVAVAAAPADPKTSWRAAKTRATGKPTRPVAPVTSTRQHGGVRRREEVVRCPRREGGSARGPQLDRNSARMSSPLARCPRTRTPLRPARRGDPPRVPGPGCGRATDRGSARPCQCRHRYARRHRAGCGRAFRSAPCAGSRHAATRRP